MTQVYAIDGAHSLMTIADKVNKWCKENNDNIKQPPNIQIFPCEYMNFMGTFSVSKYSAIIIYEI